MLENQTACRTLSLLLALALLLVGCARQAPDSDSVSHSQSRPADPASAVSRGGTVSEAVSREESDTAVQAGSAPEESVSQGGESPLFQSEPPPATEIPADTPSGTDPPANGAPAGGQDIPLPDFEGDEEQSPLAALLATPMSSAALVEQELVRLINDERRENGLEVLGIEESMQFAARIRAEEVQESMSHTRPDGTPYHTAFEEAGFRYSGKWHGENLAMLVQPDTDYDEAAIAGLLFAEWTGSPGHYQNMLGEHFHQTGVGVYIHREDGRMTVGAAQLFAGF